MIALKWSHMGLMPLKVVYLVPETKLDLQPNMCAAIVPYPSLSPRNPHIKPLSLSLSLTGRILLC